MSKHLAERGGEKIAARGAIANMKKLSAAVVLLVVLSISFALIPAVSAVDSDGDGITDAEEKILGTNPNVWTNTDGMVYTEASVNQGLINPSETTTVTLCAIANITTEKGEVDVVLVTDLSGSMGSGSGSKMEVAKDALKTFVALADDKMHIGLASFSNADNLYSNETMAKYNNGNNQFNPYEGFYDSSKTHPNQYHDSAYANNAYSDAHIDTRFTQSKTNLNSVINSYAAKGGTNIAGGINAAKKMLNESGNPDHLQVIVVMSDGIATMAPIEPDSLDAYMPSDWVNDKSEIGRIAAKKASATVKDKGIIVYAIGFGSGADETTLRDVASTGNYYFAPNNAMLAEIYSEISGEIERITGARAYHVLPADAEYVTGSASAEPTVNGKTLEWNIGDLAPDAPWDITFDVKLLNAGTQPVNVVPDSKVTYIRDSTQRNVPFPEVVVVDDNLPPVAVAKARRNVTEGWQYDEVIVDQYEPVMFDGSESYDPDGYIVNYNWTFGDGNKSTLAGPSHVYWKSGTYLVRLIVEDNRGKCEDTLVIKVNESNYNGSYADVVNFKVEEDSDINTTTGKPVSAIGNPVKLFVNTTGNSSVIYSVFVDDYKIASGNASEMENFTWISMSSGKHKIKVIAEDVEKKYCIESVIGDVNVWIKQVEA